MKKNVLICGASGFIGRNIFEKLSTRRDIKILGTCFGDRFSNDSRIIDLDLTKRENVLRAIENMDVVINAAAVTAGYDAVRKDPQKYIADNILINNILAESVLNSRIPKFIFLSCTIMYPSSRNPLKETDVNIKKVHPHYFMGAVVKVLAENLCNSYSNLGSTQFTALRPSSIYGPYDKFNEHGHIIDSIIAKVISEKSGEITIHGTGSATRDFLYVSDLVNLVEQVITNNKTYRYEVINVGSGLATSIRELAEMIIRLSRRNFSIITDPNDPGVETHSVLDITRARQLYEWKPTVDLESGIKKTLQWYERTFKRSA